MEKGKALGLEDLSKPFFLIRERFCLFQIPEPDLLPLTCRSLTLGDQ